MNHECQKTSGLGLGPFLLGALTGAVVGLLTAPRAGRETRLFLKGAADDLGANLERVPGALQKAGSRILKTGREAFVQARHDIGGAGISLRSASRVNTRSDAS